MIGSAPLHTVAQYIQSLQRASSPQQQFFSFLRFFRASCTAPFFLQWTLLFQHEYSYSFASGAAIFLSSQEVCKAYQNLQYISPLYIYYQLFTPQKEYIIKTSNGLDPMIIINITLLRFSIQLKFEINGSHYQPCKSLNRYYMMKQFFA